MRFKPSLITASSSTMRSLLFSMRCPLVAYFDKSYHLFRTSQIGMLEYCHLDTLAMVKILEKMRDMVN
jgi:hypothetical protein